MNTFLEERMKKEFAPMYNTLLYGFEHGDGWFEAIHRASKDIKAMIESEDLKDFRVTQVKEKYGGLRFYVAWATDDIFARIDELERECAGLCEICGKEGKLVDDKGWLSTLCEEHTK